MQGQMLLPGVEPDYPHEIVIQGATVWEEIEDYDGRTSDETTTLAEALRKRVDPDLRDTRHEAAGLDLAVHVYGDPRNSVGYPQVWISPHALGAYIGHAGLSRLHLPAVMADRHGEHLALPVGGGVMMPSFTADACTAGGVRTPIATLADALHRDEKATRIVLTSTKPEIGLRVVVVFPLTEAPVIRVGINPERLVAFLRTYIASHLEGLGKMRREQAAKSLMEAEAADAALTEFLALENPA